MAVDLVRVESFERVDLTDFQQIAKESFQKQEEQIFGSFTTDPLKDQFWILDGFNMENPSGKNLQIFKGRALLARREGAEIFKGVLSTEGDDSITVDLNTYAPGIYNVYIRFESVPGENQTRIFWNPDGTGSEYGRSMATRYLARWSVRVEGSSPGAEWMKIGEVDQATMGIEDLRQFFFEGIMHPDNVWKTGWSEDGGGSADDRNPSRSQFGIRDLQTFTAAMRQCIEDIKGRGLGKWYQREINGMNIGFDDDPEYRRLAVGDENFSMNKFSTNPYLYFDSNDYLVYDRSANVFSKYINSTQVTSLSTTALQPGIDATQLDLGGSTKRWKDIWVGGSLRNTLDIVLNSGASLIRPVTASTHALGNTSYPWKSFAIDGSGASLTGVESHLVPMSDNASYDLGLSTKRWKDLWIGGALRNTSDIVVTSGSSIFRASAVGYGLGTTTYPWGTTYLGQLYLRSPSSDAYTNFFMRNTYSGVPTDGGTYLFRVDRYGVFTFSGASEIYSPQSKIFNVKRVPTMLDPILNLIPQGNGYIGIGGENAGVSNPLEFFLHLLPNAGYDINLGGAGNAFAKLYLKTSAGNGMATDFIPATTSLFLGSDSYKWSWMHGASAKIWNALDGSNLAYNVEVHPGLRITDSYMAALFLSNTLGSPTQKAYMFCAYTDALGIEGTTDACEGWSHYPFMLFRKASGSLNPEFIDCETTVRSRDIYPKIDNYRNFGNASYKWKQFYIAEADGTPNSGCATNFLPVNAGLDLGKAARRWDAFLGTLDVTSFGSNATPDATVNNRLLGTSGSRWYTAYITTVQTNSIVSPDYGYVEFQDSINPYSSGLKLGDYYAPWTYLYAQYLLGDFSGSPLYCSRDLVPYSGTWSLGSPSGKWYQLYVSSTVNCASIECSGIVHGSYLYQDVAPATKDPNYYDVWTYDSEDDLELIRQTELTGRSQATIVKGIERNLHTQKIDSLPWPMFSRDGKSFDIFNSILFLLGAIKQLHQQVEALAKS
jgi:hypothetical protein